MIVLDGNTNGQLLSMHCMARIGFNLRGTVDLAITPDELKKSRVNLELKRKSSLPATTCSKESRSSLTKKGIWKGKSMTLRKI